MSGIRTHAAAVMLGVSPNTLRSWERRYGFPSPLRSAGGHRQYALAQIESLRLALAETHNVSSAISLARERGDGPSSPSRLAAALTGFDEDRAGRLLEESLALRSVERTVQELLLAAVGEIGETGGASAEFEFGLRFATGWLSALKRISPPSTRPDSVLVLDASARFDLDALHAQALEVLLRRRGARTLSLSSAVDHTRLGRAVRALEPAAVVLTGRRATLEVIGRLVYAIRSVAREAAVFDYRGALPDTGASTVTRLGETPVEACETLDAWLEQRRWGTTSTQLLPKLATS